MREQHSFTKEQSSPSADGQGMQRFGNYDLVRRIDVGGMGEVYLARQRTAFGREVAVKIIRSDLAYDVTARKRFLREAEVGAYLQHDHILSLVEFGEEQGRLFLVTPYVRGGTLSQRLQKGPLTRNEIHHIFTSLVQAVAYLHKRGVIHRDIKPSNILLDHEEDSGRIYVRLIDFGIASLQGNLTTDAALTTAGHEMGTVAYMAPERLDGVAAPSNDIYSLGIILYQMLTGRLPKQDDMVPLPAPLAYVIRRCTVHNVHERFASADELLVAFERTFQSLAQLPQPQEASKPVAPTTPPLATPSSVDLTLDDESTQSATAPQRQEAEDEDEKTEIPSQSRRSVTGEQPARRIKEMSPLPARGVGEEQPLASGIREESPVREKSPSRFARSTTQEQPSRPMTRMRAERPSRPASTTQEQPSRPVRELSPSRPGWQMTDARSVSGDLQDAGVISREIILPPLPSKGASFSGADYDAPTSSFEQEEQRLANQAALASKPPRVRRTRPTRSLVAIIFSIILVILLVMGGAGYLILQSSITAQVTVGPRVQTISTLFTMVALPGQKSVDAAAATLPVHMLTSTKKSSQQGNTTGKTDCVLNIFNFGCKQSVSFDDVSQLASTVEPGLKTQIQQDLQSQAQTQGMVIAGAISYTGGDVVSDPPVDTVSKTVTVTVTEQGNVEAVKASEAHDLAVQLLKKHAKQYYTLIDTSVQVSQPVIQHVGTDGKVTIVVAAGGVERYQVAQSELTDIQKHIEGMTAKDARTFILRHHPDLDPASIAIHISYGGNVPGNTSQIKMGTVDATNQPPVQLSPLPPPGA